MPSWKSFGSWAGSTITGAITGIGTTAILTALAEKIMDETPEGKAAIAIAAAIIGGLSGSASQLITSVSREEQKEWGAASLWRLLLTPGVSAAFAIGGAFLMDFAFCDSKKEHPNIPQCLDHTRSLSNQAPLTTYATGAAVTFFGMAGGYLSKKFVDRYSKNKNPEYELLLDHDSFSHSSENKCCL